MSARISSFGQGSIIEAVGTRLTGEDLPAELVRSPKPGQPPNPRTGTRPHPASRSRKARSHRRSRCGSACRSHTPGARRARACSRRRQQARLQRGILSISDGRAAQADVRMPADHAERGAGRVEQNPIERHAVPPALRAPHRRARPRPASRRARGSRARARGAADRCRPRSAARAGSRSAMSAVLPPARRRHRAPAGPARACQGKCDALRAQVLHRHHALGESRHLVHVARRGRAHGLRHARLRARLDSRLRAALRHILRRAVPRCSRAATSAPGHRRRPATASSAPANRRAGDPRANRRGVAGGGTARDLGIEGLRSRR
jgi:hypothetical protein